MMKVSSIHSSEKVTDEQAREIAGEVVRLYQEGKVTSFEEVLEQAKELCI